MNQQKLIKNWNKIYNFKNISIKFKKEIFEALSNKIKLKQMAIY